jgi:hypothetical protein
MTPGCEEVWRTIAVICLVLAACTRSPQVSPRMAAYMELHKGMGKREVAQILRGNRRVRIVQMGDPSDPKDDLEYWHYSSDANNDFVVFTFEGKLLQWEYHDPERAQVPSK